MPLQNFMADKAQVTYSMNLGSPINEFNIDKRIYTPRMKSPEKNENMTLEELISKIDSRREIFRKTVREETEEYFSKQFKTPQFVEDDTSAMYLQSTKDQVSYNNISTSFMRPEMSGKKLVLNVLDQKISFCDAKLLIKTS